MFLLTLCRAFCVGFRNEFPVFFIFKRYIAIYNIHIILYSSEVA